MEKFEKHAQPRRALESAIMRLIREHEAATGWKITRIEYDWNHGAVISEGVPGDKPAESK